MFKFLFGRSRRINYDVYYTVGQGTFVLRRTIAAKSEYDANRIFDQTSDPQYVRVRNATRLTR